MLGMVWRTTQNPMEGNFYKSFLFISLKTVFKRYYDIFSMEIVFWISIFFFLSFWAAPTAYGGPQTRGWIGAVGAGLYHSHSNAGSEPPLQPNHSWWQRRILNPLSKARDQTCDLMYTSQIHFCWATTGTPGSVFLFLHFSSLLSWF